MKCKQSISRAPPLYRRSPALLAGNYFYYKIGRPKMALIIIGKN